MHSTVIIVFDEKPENIEAAVEEAMMPYWEMDEGEYSELEFEPSLERSQFQDRIDSEFMNLHKKIATSLDKEKNLEYYSTLLRIKNTEGEIALLEQITGDEYNEEEDALGYWYNPNGEWDWYCIGGRWPKFFKVKYGTPTERTYTTRDSLRDPDPIYENGVDGCYKADLDIDDMIATLSKTNEGSEEPFSSAAVLLNGEWIHTDGDVKAWDIIKDIPDSSFLVLVDYHY